MMMMIERKCFSLFSFFFLSLLLLCMSSLHYDKLTLIKVCDVRNGEKK